MILLYLKRQKWMEQVTAEEVRAFVQKHFDLSQMSLSLVGDLKTLPREEMEELWMTYRTEKA